MLDLGICVVMPTYNNDGTIKRMIDSCLEYVPNIIVVDDGCTDNTKQILAEYDNNSAVTVISYEQNRGKGYALKTGLKYAKKQNFRYAITIDSDGQHFATDIPAFVTAISENPGALIVGSRNIMAENMPGGNTFANKFSNFWFKVQTLQTLPDTQTGFRLYPLKELGEMRLVTARYEAELCMLVFAAWHGVKLIPIPINVYYPPAEERVSHFRPVKDFARISVLNVALCFLAIVYGGPLMLINKIKSKK